MNNLSDKVKFNPTLFKELMHDKFPLLPAKYPNKPSPIHIANNFVTLAIGDGPLKVELRNWICGVSKFDKISLPDTENNEVIYDSFEDLLRTIFDTDGNIFRSMGSAFPISNKFLSRDPNDDGYATGLWKSIGAENRSKLHNILFDFYSENDSASALDNLFEKMGGSTTFIRHEPAADGFNSKVGSNIAEILISGIASKMNQPTHIKLEIVRQFSTLLAAFVVIGVLFDACLEDRELDLNTDPREVLGTFVYTGKIGGRSSIEQRLGMMAVVSLQDTIDRAYSGINKTFISMINEVKKEIGDADWDQISKSFSTKFLTGTSAQELLRNLKYYNNESLDQFINDFFPISHLIKAVRGIGTKSGLVWPSRKSQPRFILDSNFLTALVSFIGYQDMPVEDFVAEVNSKLGLILGYSGVTESEIIHLELIVGRKLEVRDLLVKAEKMLTLRLVSAGLARQYSDGSASLIGGVI